MIRFFILAMLIANCSVSTNSANVHLEQGEKVVFTQGAMDHLRFLEGRWSGNAPDGTIFFEAYDRQDANTLRSSRYKDATFSEVTDGSVVTFEDGQITSTWGEYVWRASNISDGIAEFEPVNAPSSFVWRRVNSDIVEVTQKWTDEKGKPQSYTLTLNRIS